MSKLRIVSKGTPSDTQVFDENGNEIEGVTQVTVVVDVKSKSQMNRVHLTLWHCEVDMKGELGELIREATPAPEQPVIGHDSIIKVEGAGDHLFRVTGMTDKGFELEAVKKGGGGG